MGNTRAGLECMSVEQIRWGDHAEQHFLDRHGVSRAEIEAAIIDPDQRYPHPGRPDRWIVHRLVGLPEGLYLLRVFYDLDPPATAVVVSWYRTSQVRRYWRTDL